MKLQENICRIYIKCLSRPNANTPYMLYPAFSFGILHSFCNSKPVPRIIVLLCCPYSAIEASKSPHCFEMDRRQEERGRFFCLKDA